MLTFTLLASILLLVFFGIFIWHYKTRRIQPPGPLGFPFVGMLPFRLIELVFSKWIVEKSDAESFKMYNDKYGPIWSIVFGKQRIVNLSSWQLINDAFIGNAELFSGRPTNRAYKIMSKGRGILFTDGEIWRGNRQLAIKALKEFGMGKKVLENRICDEGNELISYIENSSLDQIDLLNILTKGISNVIIRLVFEERSDYDNTTFREYITHLHYLSHSDKPNKKFSLAPMLFKTNFMKKLFPDVAKFLDANDYCFNFIENKCSARMKVQNENTEPNCVFDYFYRFRFTEDSPLTPKERKEEIAQSMYDLFNAGIDTSSNLLAFCCLMLGRYEVFQIDLRNEVKSLVEDYEQINLDMRKSCPKILSFIDEVQRCCSLAPKVHHRVLNKCVFHGYELYPDDIIFGDLANLFSNPDIFEKPEQFNPYRFTDESRTKYCPSKYLIPFGIGKRSCLGESIATMELFIFLAKIICKFKISLTEETSKNFDKIIRGHSGIVHAPLYHYLNLEVY